MNDEIRTLFIEARINSKPLLLDGAIGSYLQQKGFQADEILWTSHLNFSNPDAVIRIHKDYVEAGADIITTNTFRTNPFALNKAGINNISQYVSAAVNLVREAVQGEKILIAGSNAPAEDCYQKERTINYNKLKLNHEKHIDLLIDNGVNFILNETQSHLDEIEIICEYCDRNKISYLVSLYFDENLNLLSGESLEHIISFLGNTETLAVGFNCISQELFFKITRSTELPANWGFYLNCGDCGPTDKIINCKVQPDEYLGYIKKSLPLNPSFIGSCCGSNPDHIRKIRKYLDGKINS